MDHRPFALLALFSSASLFACAAASPRLPPAPALVQVPAPAPSSAPPLLLLPRPEASPRRELQEEATPEKIPALRSEGEQHILERIENGIVVISAERGVLGFLARPAPGAPIRWAGFVEGDAVLLLVGDTLRRAATPDDAIAGKFEALGRIDPAATLFASAGKIVVAAVPAPSGAYYESRDGGRHFAPSTRPAKEAMVDLAVRSDGVIVAAIEAAQGNDTPPRQGERARIFSSKCAGAWTAGPFAVMHFQDTSRGSMLTHRGDSIVVLPPEKAPSQASDFLGLDAKGRWITADLPADWLSWTWASRNVSIYAPVERPSFPKRHKGGLTWASSGCRGGSPCHGVSCLGQRDLIGPGWNVVAFPDGVCARKNVKAHPALILRNYGDGRQAITTGDCDKRAPAQRASTLVVRDGDERRVARLPTTCASGRIVGSGPTTFVYCSAEHQGRPAILHVSPLGVLTEVASGIAGDLLLHGVERASDGTSVLVATEAAWICATVGAPMCVAVPHDRFLAARPLPFGRALVARSAGEHALEIELVGEPGARPLRIAVEDDVLEIEITAKGAVRLWTSSSLTRLPDDPSKRSLVDAFLVRADGQLVPDPAARLPGDASPPEP